MVWGGGGGVRGVEEEAGAGVGRGRCAEMPASTLPLVSSLLFQMTKILAVFQVLPWHFMFTPVRSV